jgi:hypothetical protein
MLTHAFPGDPRNGKGRWSEWIPLFQELQSQLLASDVGREERDPDDIDDLQDTYKSLEELSSAVAQVLAVSRRLGNRQLERSLKVFSKSLRETHDAIRQYMKGLAYEQRQRQVELQPNRSLWRRTDEYLEDQETLNRLGAASAGSLANLLGHVDGLLRQLRAL